MMSFMKKIVKSGEDDDRQGASGVGSTGVTGSGTPIGTIGKLRQTVASGMKEIRDKAVTGGVGIGAASSSSSRAPPPPIQSAPNAKGGELRHLTAEEKYILQEVWKKEAEFEKESLQKKTTSFASVSPKAVRKARPDACRICRKRIGNDEIYFTCSECQQGVCDDCASYRKDSIDGQEGWKCSFCRRRQDRRSIEAVSGVGMRRISSAHRMETADSLKQSFSDGGRTDSAESLLGQQKSPPATEMMRRRSSSKISSPEMSNPLFGSVSSDKMCDMATSFKSLHSDRRSSSGSPRRLSVDYLHMLDVPNPSSSGRTSGTGGKLSSHPSLQQKLPRTETGNQSLGTKASTVSLPSSPSKEVKHLSKFSSAKSVDLSMIKSTGQKSNSTQKQTVPSVVKTSLIPHQINQISKDNPKNKKSISPSDKNLVSSADSLSNLKINLGVSHTGITKHDSFQEPKVKRNPKLTSERTRSGDAIYQEHSSYHHALPSSSPKKEIDRTRHSSLEDFVRERRQSVDSQKSVHLIPVPSQHTQPPSPASAASPYRIRLSSASESSLEDRSSENDADRRQRNRLRRRTRFQRQKTFIDEHDADVRDEWMMDYIPNEEEINSSFDSSSAFESFDNDPDILSYRHGHPTQMSGRPIPHIASDVALYQRRRSSDSSDYSDMSTEITGYRMHVPKGSSSRRQLMGRNAVSDYDSDIRYHSSPHHEPGNLEERHATRSRMGKSLSADNPEIISSLIIPRKPGTEPPSDDRHRILTPGYRHDMTRSNTATAYQYGLTDTRAYQSHQIWSRSARSLELAMDTQEFRRSSLNEGENIKIVIDDVDASKEKGERSLEWDEPMDWSYDEKYNAEARGLTVSTRHKASSASDVSREIDYQQSVGGRRLLPMTPDQSYHGEIGLRLWYDSNRAELVIIIVAAKGLRRRKSSTAILPRAYAKLRLLPFSIFRPIETEVANETTNPEWNKRCIFPGIVMDDILERVLELSVYDVGQTSDNKITLGMVNLPLRRADLKDNLVWYPLSNRSMSLLTHPHKASSTGMLVSTPAHDMARRLLTRSAQREMLQSQSLTDRPVECSRTNEEQCLVKSTSMDSTLLYPEDLWDQMDSHNASVVLPPEHDLLFQDKTLQRMAREIYSTAAQESLPELYCSDLEPTSEGHKKSSGDLRHVNSDTEAAKEISRQKTRNMLRRRMSRDEESTSHRAARSVVIGGSSTDTDPSQSIDSPSIKLKTNRQLPSILKKTGSRSSPSPSPSSSAIAKPASSKFGDLKLGLSLKKGFLNIDVIRARGIRYTASGYAPDTYVKTYLKIGETKGLKRKTGVVRQSTEPRFHQTLRYAVGDLYQKSLLAMIWERHKRFEHNQAIAMVELDLKKMRLTKPSSGWYQLKPLISVETESVGTS